MMKFEPSFVSNLRVELNAADQSGLALAGEQLFAALSIPDTGPVREVQHIEPEKVERLVERRRDHAICAIDIYSRGSQVGTQPLKFDVNHASGDIRVFPNFSTQSPEVSDLGSEGYQFNADMTLALDSRGRAIRTHTGTASLVDAVVKHGSKDVSDYVISCGWTEDVIVKNPLLLQRVIASHRLSRAHVTALVEPRLGIDDKRPGLVWADNRASIYDLRDLSEVPPTAELGVYVVSRHVIDTQIAWKWNRRRYHLDNRVWYQLERDICQLTRVYETNYVRV